MGKGKRRNRQENTELNGDGNTDDNGVEYSAFAVYNGLIPGVKCYEDSSMLGSSAEDSKKKKKKNKNKNLKIEVDADTNLVNGNQGKIPSGSKKSKEDHDVIHKEVVTPNSKSKRKNVDDEDGVLWTVLKSNSKKIKLSKIEEQTTSAANKDLGKGGKITEPGKNKKSPIIHHATGPPINGIGGSNKKGGQNLQKEMKEITKASPSPTKKSGNKQYVNKLGDNSDPKTIAIHETPKNGRSSTSKIKSHEMSPNPKSNLKKVATEIVSGTQKSSASSFFKKLCLEPAYDSTKLGAKVLEKLLSPMSLNKFKSEYWEKKPAHIKHSDPSFFTWLLSTERVDDMLRRHCLKYGRNVDVTSYTNGVRETVSENLAGRVRPAVLWDFYNNGCSIRILNPQSYIKALFWLNSTLQEYFGSFCGANLYLTPPDSQGFAPHYDDIEAFILQVEGKKHWKVYKPMSPDEELPRFSSRNFNEEKDKLGKPVLDIVLEQGDLLYFPRGWIHQARAVGECHSLHVTVSCQQLNSWGDLLKEHVPNVLTTMMASDVEFRKGLPTDYMDFMGIVNESTTDPRKIAKRKEFHAHIKNLMSKLLHKSADYAADQMAKKFIWDSLPPQFCSDEKKVCVLEDGEFLFGGKVYNRVEMNPDVEVKLLRKNCVRLVVEENNIRLYYNIENSKIYHEDEPQFLEISKGFAPAIENLINTYPAYVKIEELQISSGDIDDKVQLAADLWERGILLTKEALERVDDNDLSLDGEEEEMNESNQDRDDDGELDDESDDFDAMTDESSDDFDDSEDDDEITDMSDEKMEPGDSEDDSEDDKESEDDFGEGELYDSKFEDSNAYDYDEDESSDYDSQDEAPLLVPVKNKNKK